MRMEPIDHHTLAERRDLLFTPDPRLGWVFRNRWATYRPFGQPPPQQQRLPDYLSQRVSQTEELTRRRLCRTLPISGTIAIVLALFSACAASDYSLSRTPIPVGAFLLALIVITPGGAMTWYAVAQRRAARHDLELAQTQIGKNNEANAYQWRARKQAHEAAEHARLDSQPEWGAVPRPTSTQRLDVFGGTLWSWEALLTTYGTSTLAAQPLLVLDLSREVVCRELLSLARSAGIAVNTQLLPTQLATSTLLAGLSPQELVDSVVESMHGGTPDTGPSTRTDRSMDDRILTRICDALTDEEGGTVTLARIAAALRVLMGEPEDSEALTRQERRRIGTELFTVEYRRGVQANLSRIESYIHPLESLGTQADANGAGYLTCIALDSHARNVRSELLTDLIVQWVTHRIAGSSDRTPALVVTGGDELARRHLERLSDACERRGVPLTLLFRRLRETSSEMLGGGAVAFMRLGNHEDAARAADFIGRDYRFVLSQITKNVGGNESHTSTDTTGEGDSDTYSTSHSTGTSTNWGTTRSSGASYSGGGTFGFFPDRSTNRQTGRSQGGGTSESDTDGRSVSTSRNWSAAYSYAEGTNWSDADTTQRVYEYVVEPITLQHLPDHALLLIESAPGGGRTLRPVECDPAIITLDRVTITPLPDPPAPQPAIETRDAANSPYGPAAYEYRTSEPAAYGPGTPEAQTPSLPQWATPATPAPPRAPLPHEPGPPPGYNTGPRPPQDDEEEWEPGQIWPRVPRPAPEATPPDAPSHPPPQPPRQTSGPNPPRRGGPPPLFGGGGK